MSTRSELFHCFGLGTVELLRTDFVGGATVFHCRHEKKRLFCACCHSSRLIRGGERCHSSGGGMRRLRRLSAAVGGSGRRGRRDPAACSRGSAARPSPDH